MKRWLSGLLAALTLFSLTACGSLAPEDMTFAGTQPEKVIDLPVAKDAEDPAGPEESSGQEDPLPPGEASPGTAEPSDALSTEADDETDGQVAEPAPLPEDGAYTTKEDVALYIYTYGRLPDNFITKKEAQALGWSGGSLEPYAPGQCLCIGGNRFGNYEGLLPEAKGRTYTECDIDTLGSKSRGAKRIVFSNDGLIYYTEDHYESFELLYGDEGDG